MLRLSNYRQEGYRAYRYQIRQAIRRGDSILCNVCRKPIDRIADATIDHVPPITSKPPGQWEGRLAPAHRRCNLKPY